MMENMQGMLEHMQSMMGGSGMLGRRSMGLMAQEDEEEEDAPQRRMMGRRGMMGHRAMRGMGGMRGMSGMIQHHFERLVQQLELTEEQRKQMWTQLSTHAKEAIRLRADIDTLSLDLRQLVEAEPVDLPQVKQALQTIAGKEAELRFVHITAMQEMDKGLTPEQRQKLRALRRSMMGPGGMMGHGQRAK
jgi:Spy/CpxP family protein refolding chaperone